MRNVNKQKIREFELANYANQNKLKKRPQIFVIWSRKTLLSLIENIFSVILFKIFFVIVKVWLVPEVTSVFNRRNKFTRHATVKTNFSSFLTTLTQFQWLPYYISWLFWSFWSFLGPLKPLNLEPNRQKSPVTPTTSVIILKE